MIEENTDNKITVNLFEKKTFLAYDSSRDTVTLSYDLWELISVRTRKHICNVYRTVTGDCPKGIYTCDMTLNDVFLYTHSEVLDEVIDIIYNKNKSKGDDTND